MPQLGGAQYVSFSFFPTLHVKNHHHESVAMRCVLHFKYCDPSCQEDGTMFDMLLERRISSLSPPSVSIEILDAELG